MSPRAAWRLERLGFDDVCDYVGSKMDWLGSNLPWDGDDRAMVHLADLARPVPTCGPDASVGDIRRGAAGDCVVVVVDEVVLGVVRPGDLDADDDAPVESVMHEGPSTWRPHVSAAEMAGKVAGMDTLLVTTLDGRLVGLVAADDVRRAAEAGAGG